MLILFVVSDIKMMDWREVVEVVWSGVVTMCQAWLTADFLPIYHEAREGGESLDHRRRGRESLPERQILGIFDPHKNWLDDGIAPLPASLCLASHSICQNIFQ